MTDPLILALQAALLRQEEERGLCIYSVEDRYVGVDGEVDLQMLAESIRKLVPTP